MEELCNFCHQPVDRNDESVWKEVTGWVHGPKSNGLTLSDKTGNLAHATCIQKAQEGQDPNQMSLFDELES